MSRLSKRLIEIIDDFEEEIVVVSLSKYYDLIKEEIDLKWAIERVLQDYMDHKEYNEWLKSKWSSDDE